MVTGTTDLDEKKLFDWLLGIIDPLNGDVVEWGLVRRSKPEDASLGCTRAEVSKTGRRAAVSTDIPRCGCGNPIDVTARRQPTNNKKEGL